jgi:acetyl-CoA acetyltransferase
MTIADGLFAQAVAEAYGIGEREAGEAAVEGYRRAARNERGMRLRVPAVEEIGRSPYVAAPLRKGHQAPVTDGAVAIVLASGRWLETHPGARPIARLAGIGWRTDGYQLGAKRLSSLNSFRESFSAAVSMAGLSGPAELDLVELDAQTGYHEAAFRRALQLPGRCAVSPSGGPFAQNPYFCSGLIGAAEAILQVSGRAGAVQVKGARRAGAHGCNGFAQQGNATAIFEGVQ